MGITRLRSVKCGSVLNATLCGSVSGLLNPSRCLQPESSVGGSSGSIVHRRVRRPLVAISLQTFRTWPASAIDTSASLSSITEVCPSRTWRSTPTIVYNRECRELAVLSPRDCLVVHVCVVPFNLLPRMVCSCGGSLANCLVLLFASLPASSECDSTLLCASEHTAPSREVASSIN